MVSFFILCMHILIEEGNPLWELVKNLYGQPFLNTSLSLSEQITSLVTFSFLLAALYVKHTTAFIPNQLYRDLQAMVKNAVLTVAKTKVLDPELKVFVCLLGDDLLEAVFGRVRMCAGHAPNVGENAFCAFLSSAMNLDNIFTRHPEMERTPDRLNLFRMEHADHLRPRQFPNRECLRAKTCNLEACWEAAVARTACILAKFGVKVVRRQAGVESEITLRQLVTGSKHDLLRPLGGKYPSISGAVDRSLGDSASPASLDVDLESSAFKLPELFANDSTHEILARETPTPLVPTQSRTAFALIDRTSEKRVHKSSALRVLFDIWIDWKQARDRLLRVRGFPAGGAPGWDREPLGPSAERSTSTHFEPGHLFVTLISHSGHDIALAIVKSTSITSGRNRKSKSILSLPRGELDLESSPYVVSGEVLSLVPVETTLGWVWSEDYASFSLQKKNAGSEAVQRAGNMHISVSTRLIEVFGECAQAVTNDDLPHYQIRREKSWFFLDSDLTSAWMRLWQHVGADERLHNKFPVFTGLIQGSFPYFLPPQPPDFPGRLYSLPVAGSVVEETFRDAGACNLCGKIIKETERQNHVGEHILKSIIGTDDPSVHPPWQVSTNCPCGFCGRDSEHCGVRIDGQSADSDCPSLYRFRIWSAAVSSDKKPSTNVPIRCPIPNCGRIHWKYNFLRHFETHALDAVQTVRASLSPLEVSREEQLALGIPPEKVVDWIAKLLASCVVPMPTIGTSNTSIRSVCGPSNHSPARRRRSSSTADKENTNPLPQSPTKRSRISYLLQ
uniref:C2H2-type domain-containing protein n=1 Tax=Mycena chlorophos TaxID=658473 RepID=A0ABQ0KVG5_MYCCL|nr:predicted protein [Mycena chlorophos]